MQRQTTRVHGVVRLATLAAAFIPIVPSAATAQQQLLVVCGAPPSPPSQYATITSALAALTNPAPAPGQLNTITVSGTCHEEGLPIVQAGQIVGYQGLSLSGFRRLMLRAPGGAVISQVETACGTSSTAPGSGAPVLIVSDSQSINFEGLTLRGGQGVSIDSSTNIGFRGATVEKSRGAGINVATGSSIAMQGLSGPAAMPNVIQDNCGAGIAVGPGANASVNQSATIQRNFIGLAVSGFASLNASADTSGPIVVQDNEASGGRAFSGTIRVTGRTIVQHNGFGTNASIPTGLKSGLLAVAGGIIDAGGSALQVIDNNGPGIWADINSQVLFGPIVSPEAAVDVTLVNNAAEGLRLTHLSIAQSFAGVAMSANGAADATCDDSSLLFGNVSGITANACKSTERPPKK